MYVELLANELYSSRHMRFYRRKYPTSESVDDGVERRIREKRSISLKVIRVEDQSLYRAILKFDYPLPRRKYAKTTAGSKRHFSIGQQVRNVNNRPGNGLYGRIGTVVRVDNGLVKVDFGEGLGCLSVYSEGYENIGFIVPLKN